MTIDRKSKNWTLYIQTVYDVFFDEEVTADTAMKRFDLGLYGGLEDKSQREAYAALEDDEEE